MTDSAADQTPTVPPVQVLRGDMLETLRAMPADRFHAVVTDPPYGLSEPLSGDDAAAVLAQWLLEGEYHRTKGRKKPATPGFDAAIGPRLTGGGFMNATWDAFVPSPTQWAEVLRVLRPGGYALVFAGTRTAGWMAISLMLAGFEVLDSIDWLYGCLSEDTEILVDGRWVRFDQACEGRRALTFDPATGDYAWSPIQERFVYEYDDVAYRLDSEHTSQLVSRNHRCIVDRGHGWEFVRAEHLRGLEAVPYLTGSACDGFVRSLWDSSDEISCALAQGNGADLLLCVQRETSLLDASASCATRADLLAGGDDCIAGTHDGSEQPFVEGRGNLQTPTRELRSGALCALPPGADLAARDGAQGRLHHGAPTDRCDSAREGANALGVRAPRESRPAGQPAGKPDDLRNESGPQALRGARLTSATLARVSPVHYRGRVWCVRVATGAFVARRNGRVFVTGNSGFPKGGDVSKRIDETLGAEREVLGVGAAQCDYLERGEPCLHGERDERSQTGGTTHQPLTAPATDEAARWEDWSTTLKPAHEPIIVARKPLRAKSVGANLMQWQAGALNIGACRIESGADYHDLEVTQGRNTDGAVQIGGAAGEGGRQIFEPAPGRWPANVILSHSLACGEDPAACAPGCAAAALDEQGGERTSGSRAAGVRKGLGYQGADGDGGPAIEGSSGGPTRFFYCAKASRADRECGLEDLPADHDLRKKGHPTVKPTALMRWLVRLVCPPAWRDEAAGEVLDPFGGSGSTGVALALEGFRGVLVERDERFAEIAARRVARAVEARASGEVPKAWREKKPKPLERKGCADACPVATLDEQSGDSRSGQETQPRGKGGIWTPSQGTPCGPQYGDTGGASRFFATFVADPADVPDEQIARYEATVEGAPSPEEVVEARAVAGAAVAILADPAADPDARAWAEHDLRVRGLLADEPAQEPAHHEPGEAPEEVAAAAGAGEAAAEPPAPAARPPLACREVAQGVEIERPAEGADELGAALLAAGAVEVEPAGWLVPWDALDAADAALVAGGWALAGPAQEAA